MLLEKFSGGALNLALACRVMTSCVERFPMVVTCEGMLLNEFSGGALNMALALQSKDFSSRLQWIVYWLGTGTTICMKIEEKALGRMKNCENGFTVRPHENLKQNEKKALGRMKN